MIRNMKRNSLIDMMRFAFAVLIMFLHSDLLGPVDDFPFYGGYIAVDFFFILSGYYAFHHIDFISMGKTVENPAKETFLYIKHKYIPIYIAVALSLGFDLAAMCIIARYSVSFFFERFVITIFESMLLHSIVGVDGFRLSSLWYLSSLLLALVIVVYLTLKYRDLFKNILIFTFPVFIYGFFFKTAGTICRFDVSHFYIINEGVLRAVAGVCMGGIAFRLSEGLRGLHLGRTRKLFLTILELAGYIGVYWGCMQQDNTILDFLFIIILMLAVAITTSGKSYTGGFCIPFSAYLGKLSFAMYLVHPTVNVIIRNVMLEETYWQRIPWYFLITFVCAVILTKAADLITKKKS